MSEVTITREANSALVRPAGDVVESSVPELRSAMRELVSSGVRKLTVDLDRAQMMDACGLGALIAAHNSLNKVGGQLAVINASNDILALFEVVQMRQHFCVSGE